MIGRIIAWPLYYLGLVLAIPALCVWMLADLIAGVGDV